MKQGTLKHNTVLQAIFFAWYNPCGKRELLLKGATPAMAGKNTGLVWAIRELLERAAEV